MIKKRLNWGAFMENPERKEFYVVQPPKFLQYLLGYRGENKSNRRLVFITKLNYSVIQLV